VIGLVILGAFVTLAALLAWYFRDAR